MGPAMRRLLLLALVMLCLSPAGSHAQQQFRDPKTGTIWTPENVGRGAPPMSPSDRAFDPRTQAVVTPGIVEQRVDAVRVGSIPVTAGPTVPLVVIHDASLTMVLRGNWQVALQLDNNSADTRSPVVTCGFKNGNQVVQQTRALLPATPGGTRVAFKVNGPRSDIFVDSADCGITQP